MFKRRFAVDVPPEVVAGGDKEVEKWAKENKLEKLTGSKNLIGVLHNEYVPKHVAKEVNELLDAPSMARQIWLKYLNAWKSSKTVFNPSTHGRNIMGNIPFSDFASAPMTPCFTSQR